MTLNDIILQIREFRDQRDWAQFHNPKDMATAISIEASELLEHFLWKNGEEINDRVIEKRGEIQDEIADIAVYVIELADNLNIDLFDAIQTKMAKNAAKYPTHESKAPPENTRNTHLNNRLNGPEWRSTTPDNRTPIRSDTQESTQ